MLAIQDFSLERACGFLALTGQSKKGGINDQLKKTNIHNNPEDFKTQHITYLIKHT